MSYTPATKVRLNKATLSQMPAPVSAAVQEWAAQHRKKFISVQDTDTLYVAEDAKLQCFNLLTGASQTERAGGEWAGATRLQCNTYVKLPRGVVVVETNFFCGVPHLTLHQGTATPVPELAVGDRVIAKADAYAPVVYDTDGTACRRTLGTVTELLRPNIASVKFDGYPNTVDMLGREIQKF